MTKLTTSWNHKDVLRVLRSCWISLHAQIRPFKNSMSEVCKQTRGLMDQVFRVHVFHSKKPIPQEVWVITLMIRCVHCQKITHLSTIIPRVVGCVWGECAHAMEFDIFREKPQSNPLPLESDGYRVPSLNTDCFLDFLDLWWWWIYNISYSQWLNRGHYY